MVRDPHPFHSFSKIPQTLLNVTFNDISMLQEKASNIGLPPKKPVSYTHLTLPTILRV